MLAQRNTFAASGRAALRQLGVVPLRLVNQPSSSSLVCRSGAVVPQGSGLSPELKKSIDEFIATNKVVVFMKGTKQAPACGFSGRVVQVMSVMGAPFETVNILDDEKLRTGMKEYSQWPTFPQVYINGEFFGGADIVMEAAQNGQLKEALEVASLE